MQHDIKQTTQNSVFLVLKMIQNTVFLSKDGDQVTEGDNLIHI